jgi:predicted CopG family antitoxin
VATNLAIDPELLEEALRVGKKKTKKATVTEALEEYIRRRKQMDVLELFGTVEYEEGYDYKEQRKRDS